MSEKKVGIKTKPIETVVLSDELKKELRQTLDAEQSLERDAKLKNVAKLALAELDRKASSAAELTLQTDDAASETKNRTDVVRVNIFATKAMRRQWKGFAAIAGYDDMGAFIRFAVNEYIRNHPLDTSKLGEP